MCAENRLGHIRIRPMRWRSHVLVAVLTTVFGLPHVLAQAVSESDLTELSIEDLMEQKIISVSKTEQAFSDTAAAVFVMTQDDLRRTGITNIPEALRMVPGVQVARIDSNKWAITARGFNGRFANKLLVLIDGRTVYTPSFSGVYWETQDLVLEDIERIEVIRGPGASVWGANAVNGIINIITKSAEDTQGGLLSFRG
jgi:iron complex outermembrane recepter protein